MPHWNKPGFLSRLNAAAGDAGFNVASQFLQTEGELGYAVADLEGDIPQSFLGAVMSIDGVIRARLIPGPGV